ncbi:MAG TPA: lytic transglycosylase domain-containing protein [Thermoanaerobaculia bacterium]|nr:lytic transglycosylase domain-containing protein [Thermoanaerobaculia bacterium]
MKRYRFDNLTLTVLVLSVFMLNVLLFSAGVLVGSVPNVGRASARPSRARVVAAPTAPPERRAEARPTFVMPRWSPPADPQVAPQPQPELTLVARREPHDLTALIEEAAHRESVPPYLIAAVARVESNLNPRAISHKGAIGLMQVMPETAKRFGFDARRLHDPVHNVAAGATYLRWLLERYDGDLDRVLAAYNAGEGAVAKYDGIPPYKETQDFVKRVRAVLAKTTTSQI